MRTRYTSPVFVVKMCWIKNAGLTVIKIAIRQKIPFKHVTPRRKESQREKEGGTLAPNYKERTWLLLSVIGLYSPSL